MARIERWIEPFEARNARPAQASDAGGNRLQAAAQLTAETLRRAVTVKRGTDAAEIIEHPRKARGVEWDHLRCALEGGRDLTQGHRAHRAERLSEDEVASRVAKRTFVEVECALAASAGVAHEGVDLASRRVRPDRRGGHAWERVDRGGE